MAQHNQGHGEHRGTVKDPEHDGRLKENREAGRTKGTTEGSRERAEARGHEPAGSSHSGSTHSGSSHSGGSHGGSHSQAHAGSKPSQGGADDLKQREYRDEHGEVHHHTREYME